MKRFFHATFRASLLALLLLAFASFFTPTTHAQPQNTRVPHDLGGSCAPAGSFNWDYPASIKPRKTNFTVVAARIHTQFRFDGRCGKPQVVGGPWCNEAPRLLVPQTATSCYWYDAYTQDKEIWSIGTNPVIFQDHVVCQLDVMTGTDEYGSFLTSLGGTNC